MASITSAGTGFWDVGSTWTGGAVPVLGDKVTIQATHVVTIRDTRSAGDDTSSTTNANNAIHILGSLIFSRVASSQLTCRGTLLIGASSTFDMGTIASPIPAGITARLLINDSATMAAGKHGIICRQASNAIISAVGVTRSRNVTLTTTTIAGATSISVSAATGWEIGDALTIASDTYDPARAQVVTVTSVSGLTLGVTAITNARTSGCRVANLSSNIGWQSANAAFPGPVGFSIQNGCSLLLQDVSALDCGGVSWSVAGSAVYSAAFGVEQITDQVMSVTRCVARQTGAISSQAFAVQGIGGACAFSDCAAHLNLSGTTTGVFLQGRINFADVWVYSCTRGHQNNANAGTVLRGGIWSSTQAVIIGTTIGCTYVDWQGWTINASLVQVDALGTVTFVTCNLRSTTRIANSSGPVCIGRLRMVACVWNGSPLTVSLIGQSAPLLFADLETPDNVALDYRRLNLLGDTVTDGITRRRGIRAIKCTPATAGTSMSFAPPALSVVAGVPLRLLAALRADAAYGVGNPPVLTISGSGVSYSTTMPANTDTWNLIDTTITPTITGDLNIMITARSATVGGSCWLDGLLLSPYVQSAWHYGFLASSSLGQIVDPSITLSEAAAGALTATATLDDVYDSCQLWSVGNITADLFVPIATAAGSALDIGAKDVVINSGAGAVIAFASNVITIKASALAVGSKFSALRGSGNVSVTAGAISTPLARSGGVVSAGTFATITGRIDLTGTARLDCSAPATLPAGSSASGTTVRVTAATSGAVLDARAWVWSVSSTIENASGQPITVRLLPAQVQPTKLQTSGTITFDSSLSITVTHGSVTGSRAMLRNETASTELDNVLVGSGGYSKTLVQGTHYTAGDTLALYLTYQSAGVAYEPLRILATSGSNNIILLGTQILWTYHNAQGIDGSTVTECATDFTNVQVDVNDGDNATTKARIAAFIVHAMTTIQGIRSWFGAIFYKDAGRAIIDVSKAAISVDNVKPTPLNIADAFHLDRSDGASMIGQSQYTIRWDNSSDAVVIETGTSGLTATESAALLAVATKADDLHQIHGLKVGAPLTVTPTSRTAGSISQTITGDGVSTSTVTRTA